MASIFKRNASGSWIITWFDHSGRRREKSSRTTDKRTAERIAGKLEADAALRREGVVDAASERLADAAKRPIGQLIENYLDHCRHAGQVAAHVADKKSHLNKFVAANGIARLEDLDAGCVEGHLQGLLTKGKAPRTANLCRSHIVAFMEWCRKSGLVSENRLRQVPVLETAGQRRRVRRSLSQGELARLLKVARERDSRYASRLAPRATIYRTAALTGLRRNELRQLQWDDVDFEQGVIRVRVEVGKARRADVIPLHPDLMVELQALKPEDAKPLDRVFRTMPTNDTVRDDFKRAGIPLRDAAGRVIDLHALRTTLGTELARQGVAPQVAQRIMRHADYRTTMQHYVTLGIADAVAAIGKVPSAGKELASTEQVANPDPSRFPSSPQQNPQHSGHDSSLRGASGCDDPLPSDRSPDEPKPLHDASLCEEVLVGSTGCSGTPGRT